MKVVYHPDVQRDVSRILRHYDGINDRLGDDERLAVTLRVGELRQLVTAAALDAVAGRSGNTGRPGGSTGN